MYVRTQFAHFPRLIVMIITLARLMAASQVVTIDLWFATTITLVPQMHARMETVNSGAYVWQNNQSQMSKK